MEWNYLCYGLKCFGFANSMGYLSTVWLGPNTVSLCHSLWMYLTLISQQKVNGAAFESWWFDLD